MEMLFLDKNSILGWIISQNSVCDPTKDKKVIRTLDRIFIFEKIKKSYPLHMKLKICAHSLGPKISLFQIASVRASKGVEESRVEPRFFLFYWYTSTITTTATSYTTTTTFSLRACTPATFSYSACG